VRWAIDIQRGPCIWLWPMVMDSLDKAPAWPHCGLPGDVVAPLKARPPQTKEHLLHTLHPNATTVFLPPSCRLPFNRSILPSSQFIPSRLLIPTSPSSNLFTSLIHHPSPTTPPITQKLHSKKKTQPKCPSSPLSVSTLSATPPSFSTSFSSRLLSSALRA
jgi:hypothetical protein